MRQCAKILKGYIKIYHCSRDARKGPSIRQGRNGAISGEGAGAMTSIPWLDYSAGRWLVRPLAVAPTIKSPAGMERSGIPAR